MALRRVLAATILLALPSPAFAQAPPPAEPPKSPVIIPPPAKPPPPKPPEKKVDTEFDPDAKPAEPPPLVPVQPGQWGVGGKEEEGRFAPQAKKKEDEEARAKREEEARKKPLDLGPPRLVWIDTVVGFGTMREVTGPDTNPTKTTGASFIFGFSWRLGDTWSILARFPFVRASVDGDIGPANTFAIGNLELGTKPSFQLTPRLFLPAEFSIFIPIAQGDFFPEREPAVPIAQARMNQAASWGRAWEDMPLFAQKRLGVRLGAGIVWVRETSEETASATPALAGGLRIEAGTRFDFMFRTGGGPAPELPDPDDPSKTIPTHTVSSPTIAWTTRASVHYAFFDGKLEPGLRLWLTYASLPVFTTSTDYSGAQFVMEPQINGRFPVVADKSLAIHAGIGFMLPLGGPLGGGNAPQNAAIKGFRINAGFAF